MAKPKIYVAQNLDGLNRGMAKATNLGDAADLLGTTVGNLKSYGWHEANPEEEAAYLAAGSEGAVFLPINHYAPHTFWRPETWKRSEINKAREASFADRDAEPSPKAGP